MKNHFYFILKTLFVLSLFLSALSWLKYLSIRLKILFDFTVKNFNWCKLYNGEKNIYLLALLTYLLDFLVIKNGLIRKTRLISKFMTSSLVNKTIAIHILSNTLRSKGNQTMGFDQLIECNKILIIIQKSCRKWGFFGKALYEVKASGLQFSFIIFW